MLKTFQFQGSRFIAGAGYNIFFRLGLIKFWKMLPIKLRRQLVHTIVRLPARNGDVPEEIRSPVHLVGLSSSHSSFGWAVRAAHQTLIHEGYEPKIWNVAARFGADHQDSYRTNDQHKELNEADVSQSGTLLLCLNPNFIAHALAGLPETLPYNKRIIGYFVWELELIPENWTAGIRFVDEIWTPSVFVRDAFIRAFPDKPIRLIPYAIEISESACMDKKKFGLPDRFCILIAANLQSGTSRKNIQAAIEAFMKAFPADNDDDAQCQPTLVLKLSDTDAMPERFAWFAKALEKVPHRLITNNLSDDEMWGLIASCDAVFSMHRSEGYGLLMRQGLMLNKPVIATGWSGNVDFMKGEENAYLIDYELVSVEDSERIYRGQEGQRWAEPNVDHAVSLLQQVHAEWLR